MRPRAAFDYDHDKEGAGIDERQVVAPIGTFGKEGATGGEVAAG